MFSRLLSEPACFFAVRFTLSQPSPLARKTTHLLTFFFGFIHYACHQIFVNQHVLLHWNSTKLPWGMQRICGLFVLKTIVIPFETLWACLHGGGGPQVLGVQIKMRDCTDRWVTPTKRVTSPTWGPPPPCKQALCPVTLTHFLNL